MISEKNYYGNMLDQFLFFSQLDIILIVFSLYSLIYSLMMFSKFTELKSHLEDMLIYQNLDNIYSNQTLNGILINQFEKKIILVDSVINNQISIDSYNYLYKSCQENQLSFSSSMNQLSQMLFSFKLQSLNTVSIFPNKQTNLNYIQIIQSKFNLINNRVQQDIQLDFVEVLSYNQLTIMNLCNTRDIQLEKVVIEHLQYLVANLFNQQKISSNYTKNLSDRVTDTQDVFNLLYIIFGSLIGFTFLTMFVLFIHYFKLINKYKSKVLLLLARINVDEVEQEITKLNESLKILDDPYEQWITTSFYQILTKKIFKAEVKAPKKQSEKKQIVQKNENETNNDNDKKEKVSTFNKMLNFKGLFNNFKNKITNNLFKKNNNQSEQIRSNAVNKGNSQKQLSTLIQNHHLSIIRQVLIISFFCITGLIFFFVIIITNYSKTKEIEPLNNLYFKQIQNTQSLNTVITLGYLLISNQITKQNDQKIPNLITQDKIDYFQLQLKNIQASINEIANSSTDSSIFTSESSSQSDQILSIYQEDLCKLAKTLESCKDNESPFRQVIQKGLSGILTSYTQLYFNNLYLQSSDQKINTVEEIEKEFNQFIQNTSFKQLIINGFDLPMYFMMEVNKLINDSIYNQVTFIENVIFIYFFSVGLFIGLMWLLFSIKTRRRFNDELRSINFSLTLLPYNKCQEEATIYILKSIQKI